MPAKTFRELLAKDGPLILPGAHDALSARLIAQAGFEGYFIGGFPLVGARHGVPDLGLKGFGEVFAGIRDIMAASDLPVFVDADDGYGDVKNVVHTVHAYERLGVAALQIEDQRWPKRCGHMAGKVVVPAEEMEAKVRAATSERMHPETFIWARTDARGPHGLDEAMRRAERYLRAGADSIFIEALRSVEEMETVSRAFDVPLQANPLEGGISPILKPEEYFRLGYKVIVYGINLLVQATKRMKLVLEDIRSGRFELTGTGASFQEFLSVVGFDDWAEVENRHAPKQTP